MGKFDTGDDLDGLSLVEILRDTDHSWNQVIQIGRVRVIGDRHGGIARLPDSSDEFGGDQGAVTEKRMGMKVYDQG